MIFTEKFSHAIYRVFQQYRPDAPLQIAHLWGRLGIGIPAPMPHGAVPLRETLESGLRTTLPDFQVSSISGRIQAPPEIPLRLSACGVTFGKEFER